MWGVVKTAPGDGMIELRELPEPAPGPGQVLIKVQAAGICGTDIHIWHDEYRSWPPVVLGHEVAGEVVGWGDGVTGLTVGERVTTETYVSTCGHCRLCRDGRRNLCPERRSIGSAYNGGFTSLVVVPAANLHALPEALSFQEGALTEPLACVVHGALEQPRLRPGDVAVIAGPGAIGLLTLQAVKAAGLVTLVIGTRRDEHRLNLATELGADAVAFVEESVTLQQTLDDLTAGYGADIVYECSGAGPSAAQLLTLVRRAGQYAQIGLFGRPVAWDLDQICYKELTVTGSNASVPTAWERALALLASGAVRTGPLISGVYPVSEWRTAFDIFEARSGIKTVLQPID